MMATIPSFSSFEDLLAAISTYEIKGDKFRHIVRFGPIYYTFYCRRAECRNNRWYLSITAIISEIGWFYRTVFFERKALSNEASDIIKLCKSGISEMIIRTRDDIFPFSSTDPVKQKRIERLKRDYIEAKPGYIMANSLISLLHMRYHERAGIVS